MSSLSSYILPFFSIVMLLVALVAGFDCIWRTERALAGYIRLVVFLMSLALAKAVIFVLNILAPAKYALLVQVIDLVSALLFLSSILLLFRIIRSLHRSRP